MGEVIDEIPNIEKVLIRSMVERTNDGQPPAKFYLELPYGMSIDDVEDDIQSVIPQEIDRLLYPFSNLDHGVLVLELSDYTFAGVPPIAAFTAGYALSETFDMKSVTPDVPTAFFPENLPANHYDPLEREGLDWLVPGCWQPKQNGLAHDWALTKINAQDAWEYSKNSGLDSRGNGVVIAQPDTGTRRHGELNDVVWVPGFDFLKRDDDPTDDLTGLSPGHGTSTASVVVSRESGRITGSAPLAHHMPLRAIDSVVQVTQGTVAESIDWAVQQKADVITMSLGGLPMPALHRAVQRAVAADVIVMAAAGNCVTTVVWPARYAECIAVAGTDNRNKPWPGSCRGAAVDISAPGQNVWSAKSSGVLRRGDEVAQAQGTSYAVALVAGVAALWLSHHGRPNLIRHARNRGETLQTMFKRLLQATAHRPDGWDSFEMGAGIVDARALLGADLNLGLDRETVAMLPDRDSGEAAIASLVSESLGLDAVENGDLDWHQAGPELAHLVLSRQLATSRQSGVMRETADLQESELESGTRPEVSQYLDMRLTNTHLREWVGLSALITDQEELEQ